MNNPTTQSQTLLSLARRAVQNNQRSQARFLAQAAVRLSPDYEEAWLLLAALASPRASLAYLSKVLSINPKNQTARKGLDWAIKRARLDPTIAMRRAQKPSYAAKLPLAAPYPRGLFDQGAIRTSRSPVLWIGLVLVILVIAGLAWFGMPTIPFASAQNHTAPHSIAGLFKPSLTPTATATATATPTPTSTSTPTITPSPTPTNTFTPIPTQTSTPAPTATPKPAATQAAATAPPPKSAIPPDVSPSERWVDVNLSTQSAYAFEGSNVVKSFVVSTGTYLHPTVTGQYHIYVMYRYALMTGPGYYLPNVPYVMYFYEGYGLHGTYWHHNFGHPMSHGCVNFKTEDAGWLYQWVSVGTLVNIHY